MPLEASARRAIFVSLAVAALLVVVAAVAVVLLALPSAKAWLIGCVVALVAIVGAEIVLLVLARGDAMEEEDEEPVYEFEVEPDEARP